MFGSLITAPGKTLFRNLNKGFRRHRAAPGAALFIQKAQNFAQRVGVRGVPQKSSVSADVNQADLLQFFQMMRERGGGNVQLLLNLTGHRAGGMHREKKTQDGQTRFGAQRGKTVRRAGNQSRGGLFYIFVLYEKWIGV